MEAVTLHTRMGFILPPMEGIRNSNGKGAQEKARGWAQILKVFFSRDFETRIIVFVDDVTFKVTRPSNFVRVQSYFEALWYPHLYFDHKSNIIIAWITYRSIYNIAENFWRLE